MPETWCSVCGTQHAAREVCPGDLAITEPERHGWRVLVHTGSRTEVYGVLVAPSRGLWRARVLTFPRMLWSIPGGRGTVKFVGATPAEAEKHGVDFIRHICERRGYTIMGEPAIVEGAGDVPNDVGMPQKILARRRYLKNLKVAFGKDAPQIEGLTSDLSHGGLFVITEQPLPADSPIKLRVELEEFSLPLTGRVAWCRSSSQDGRPVGIGVQLTQAPPMYRRYIDQLRAREAEEPEDEQA